MSQLPIIKRIVSGGQTGVDRAALDVAIELGLAIGGWCPSGRKAEDGPIPPRYPLVETSFRQYGVRTRWNVRDTDGTLILTAGEPTGGTGLTAQTAERLSRPLLVLDLDLAPDPQVVREWLALHCIQVLNVAGPRESTVAGVYERTAKFLRAVLSASAAK